VGTGERPPLHAENAPVPPRWPLGAGRWALAPFAESGAAPRPPRPAPLRPPPRPARPPPPAFAAAALAPRPVVESADESRPAPGATRPALGSRPDCVSYIRIMPL